MLGMQAPLKPAFDSQGMRLFDSSIKKTRGYLEYGCGGSTIHALANSSASVISVDTSKVWVDAVVRAAGHAKGRLHIDYVDLGPVGDWGIPKGYASRSSFRTYVEAPWKSSVAPDLVLVDGRFRVSCFLQSLLWSNPGTRILFDDYIREDYHVVEEVVKPQTMAGRMGLFTTPTDFDRDAARALLEMFLIVWK
jgi:hypothetical protein